MKREKVHFKNKNQEQLEGYLELPSNQAPHNYAIFAHCFTCSKNLKAASHISKALTDEGFGVLRFDFTGLGGSEGNFAETNFSGNVKDLLEAASFLEKNYAAPSLLIGHSLGGAAVIFAANKLPKVKAVATIGAPSNPEDVRHLLRSKEDEILREGKAIVSLEGRPFTIKKQFLDDLKNQPLQEIVGQFKKALLLLHSPQDRTVGIQNAEAIYTAAIHPKSFISLDGADHLLTKEADSLYVGKVIGTWATRYLSMPQEVQLKSKQQIVACTANEEGFTTYIRSGQHRFIADEPEEVGGKNYGPNPYDYVTAGLAACTNMTLMMYARRKKWDLQKVEVTINHAKEHFKDCENCDQANARIDVFRKTIVFKGDLSQEQKQRLMEIANQCPVHRTLTGEVNIISDRGEV